MKIPLGLFNIFLILIISCSPVKNIPAHREIQILPPEELYGELFYDVQSNPDIFPDSKTFVDVIPKKDIRDITKAYRDLRIDGKTDLRRFLEEYFYIPEETPNYQSDSSSINIHINKLWDVLKRPADEKVSGTLLPLPNPYIVPGGRFREIYYWDSYFTMLGLAVDGEIQAIRDMTDNFSYLIDTYGFIPNGNRSYYLSRSQPPFYSLMVALLAEIDGDQTLIKYLPYLEKEYEFWMRGENELSEKDPLKTRVVRMPEGEILNRYWDHNTTPRPESYREDVETAREAVREFPGRTIEEVYRDIRAAAESGWDFSSRWLNRGKDDSFGLSSIHTTEIIPVDLNSLLFHLELMLYRANVAAGQQERAVDYKIKYENRKTAISKYLWGNNEGFFMDYHYPTGKSTSVISLAGVYPLFFEIATESEAHQVARVIEQNFLREGGVVTTPYHTGEQWDAPNGWAPLQWITISALRNYGFMDLAEEIKERWLKLNRDVYSRNFKMLEKYNVEDLSKESGGGEYPTQDGFGWTNGIFQKLSKEDINEK